MSPERPSAAGALAASAAPLPRGPSSLSDDLLLVSIGGSSYAVRLGQVAGVAVEREIVAVPSEAMHLLGIASVRSLLVAVYDLGSVLGHACGGPTGRCILMAGPGEPIGLAVDALEGLVRVERRDISNPAGAAAQSGPIQASVRIGEVVRPLVDLPSVIQLLESAAAAGSAQKETGQ